MGQGLGGEFEFYSHQAGGSQEDLEKPPSAELGSHERVGDRTGGFWDETETAQVKVGGLRMSSGLKG